MPQKILVKVQMTCNKCRTKALKISATTPGVNQVSIQGDDRDHVEVIGDGVDSVCLTQGLRKKLGYAHIVKVEQIGGESTSTPASTETSDNQEEDIPAPIPYYNYGYCQYPQVIRPMYCQELYYCHEPPMNNCSIM